MLKGEKVYLTADIPRMARQWRNMVEVRRWCRQHTLLSEDDHEGWLDSIARDRTIKMFGVVAYPNQAEVEVGVVGFTSINHLNQTAEFSCYVSPNHRRSGFATDALRTLFTHGFEDFNLNRIWGETYDGNPATVVFERLGMKKEGTLWQSYFRGGQFINSHIYGLIRGELK